MTLAAKQYGESKLPFFRNGELHFETDYINKCRLNTCMFILNSMVNYVACNGIVHSVSIMTVSILCKKLIPLKLADIIFCHIFHT